jgi:hypothetical protein
LFSFHIQPIRPILSQGSYQCAFDQESLDGLTSTNTQLHRLEGTRLNLATAARSSHPPVLERR